MRKITIMLIVLAMLSLCVPAMAGDFKDTIKGQNASCPMLVSNEVVKQFSNVTLPFMDGTVDVQIGIKYTNSVRSFTRDNSITITNRIIF